MHDSWYVTNQLRGSQYVTSITNYRKKAQEQTRHLRDTKDQLVIAREKIGSLKESFTSKKAKLE